MYIPYTQAVISAYVCQKPGMDRNYCLIVFIVYMSSSDTQKVAKCCVHEDKSMLKKRGGGGGGAIRGIIQSPVKYMCKKGHEVVTKCKN